MKKLKIRKNQKKFFFTTFVVFSLFSMTAVNVFPAIDLMKFEQIGSIQGFPQEGNVYYIFQDKKGFMWFGTHNGLNKYDGYRFTVYKNKPDDPNSPGHRVVRYIYEDLEGILWLGTENSLDKFHRGTETFSHYRTPIKGLTSSNFSPVYSIVESAAAPGILWLTTLNGLVSFNKKEGTFVPDPVFADYSKKNPVDMMGMIMETSPGILWFISHSGLYKYDLQKKVLTGYRHDPNDPGSLSSDYIYCLSKSTREPGVLWIGTWEGLNKFDTRKETFTHYKHDPGDPFSLSHNFIWSIYESPVEKGIFWVGTLGGGLNKFDSITGKAVHFKHDPNYLHSPGSDTILSVFQDRSGVLWLGVRFVGLYKADRPLKNFIHYYFKPNVTDGLSDNLVFSIFEPISTPGIFWIGTANGLNRFNRDTGEFTVFRKEPGKSDSLSSNDIRQVYECPSLPGILWIGTGSGEICKFDIKKNSCVHYRHDPGDENTPTPFLVSVFHESLLQPGVLWMATRGGGITKLDTAAEVFITYRFDAEDSKIRHKNQILDIYETRSEPGILWLTSYDSGLIRFNTKAGKFSRYMKTTGAGSPLLSIYESPQHPGFLWISTLKGLVKFNINTGLPTAYPGLELLLGYFIKGIMEDEQGNFWLSTDNGLLKFNPEDGRTKRYDKRDGLQGNEFSRSACKSRQGEMFFGGFDGFNSFYPSQIRDNSYVPPIVITGLQVFNRPVKVGQTGRGGQVIFNRSLTEIKKIKLSHKDKVFTIEFAALSYTLPEKNCYAYKMDGFDEEWVECGTNRSATYTGLSPGDYTFRVKGSNNDGVWNELGNSIRVIIIPPWWRTKLAYALYIVLLALVIIFLNRSQRAQLIRREQDKSRVREAELRAQAAETQAQAVEAENRRKSQELEEARKLQLSMLPDRVPDQANFDIAVYMNTAHEVGGDYYDFYNSADGTLIAAIGDATGHGLKAGHMVSIIKGIFLSGDLNLELDINEFFNNSTRTIKQMHLDNLFMGLTLAKFNDNRGVIASAGMPPVYLLRKKNRAVEEILLKAPPIGAFSDFSYPLKEVELCKGDTIVLLSDGLPELFNKNEEMFGYSRFKELLKEVCGKSPAQIIEHFVVAAESWLDGKARDDDITFVVLKKT